MAMKSAVVTGVSRGIGHAVAAMLIADGWRVLGLSRMPPDDILTMPDTYQWLHYNLGSRDIGNYLGVIARQFDCIDALVHCAAIQGPIAPLAACERSAWDETIRVNLMGTFRVLHAFLPLLHRSDDGRILLFSGGGAFNGRENHTAYAASKAGVVALMESLADELRHSTVTVNCVAPGYVPSGMPGAWAEERVDEAMVEAVNCVRHLLSPAARGLSGKTISAPHDNWSDINPMTVASVNASMQGTRWRHPIQRVVELTRVLSRNPAGRLA